MTTNLAVNIFTDNHWFEIQNLLKTLDSRQTAWLSGYLAGQNSIAHAHETPSKNNNSAEVLIAFGGETGNSKNLALQLEKLARSEGINTVLHDLATLKVRQLKKYPFILLICSTHGDGDPPEPVMNFYNALMDDATPVLDQLKYAVLALGDSTYEHFCATGKHIDERLATLGGNRLVFRQDCDVNYESQAQSWMDLVIKMLPKTEGQPTDSNMRGVVIDSNKYSKSNRLTTSLLENKSLTNPRRSDSTHHISLSLEVDNFEIEPGDAIAILVKNPQSLVDSILADTGLNTDHIVSINGVNLPLGQALSEKCDLTIPSRDFMQLWESLETKGLLQKAMGESEKEKKDFIKNQQVSDLIHTYKLSVNPQQLVNALRPLQPRLYDIANSLGVVEDELHLCIKKYFYDHGDKTVGGIASNYLTDLQADNQLEIYPHKHARFHLPESHEVPLILIADGTGVAPFRAFIQEIKRGSRINPCWLVFSEQNFEEDFLYQIEWQQALAEGVIKHLTPIFYRDTPGKTHTSALIEHEEQLKDWLQLGAHIYFSGDKSILSETENSLKDWAESDMPMNTRWSDMNKNKHIHRNLY